MNPMRMRSFNDSDGGTMSRRAFLKTSAAAGAGLTLGIWFASDAAAAEAQAAAGTFAPNAFLRVGRDNTVTVVVKHLEMGQGVYTGLPTLVAEELDAAWSQVRVEGAPADASLYYNTIWKDAYNFEGQGTGGSTAMANSYDQYRQAGATARAMLVSAAAQKWSVPADSIQVKNGVVSHASGKKATLGELADSAAQQAVPASVKLKDPKDFVYIGKHVTRTDSKAKSSGSARFTQDVKLPDMLTAVVAHPPRFGQKAKDFDTDSVQGLPGIRYVVGIPNGVAVVATSFWAAKKGRDALKVEWSDGSGFAQSSSDILADYRKLAATPGAPARVDGDAAKAIAGAAKTLDASYEFPYLAHAAMEPMNCVVKLTQDSCEIWNGEQFQTPDVFAVSASTGLKPEQIKLNMLYAGGSFGRRASSQSDYILEAVAIAKALVVNGKPGIPVKLVWTREDDMRGGFYRPAYVHSLKAGLDANGNIVGWQHRIVGQSINSGTAFAGVLVKNGVDATSVEGAVNLPYAIPNLAVDLHSPSLGVPVLWWRSVGSTHNAYSTETFIDELAVTNGKDPVAFRKAMLTDNPRHIAALDLAAEKSDWSKALAPGKAGEKRGRGVAVHESFKTVVAQVAEVTVGKDGKFRVDRVVCAVHCGTAVNPDIVKAQMEGGIGFGLSAALYGKITLKDGVVEQSNFNDYPVLLINEMPAIEVYIVPSTDLPTGVGEPAVPVIAPAVANALAAATGKRVRSLPISLA